MTALWIILLALPAGALPAFDFGAGCESEAVEEGKADTMSFTEVQLNCRGLKVKAEILQPVASAAVERQILNETIMVQESYAATRNPYAGFISDTAQCPAKNNFTKQEFKFAGVKRPLLIGRLTERGLWGACGSKEADMWGAVTFAAHGDAMLKLKILAGGKLTRKEFGARVQALLGAIKPK